MRIGLTTTTPHEDTYSQTISLKRGNYEFSVVIMLPEYCLFLDLTHLDPPFL